MTEFIKKDAWSMITQTAAPKQIAQKDIRYTKGQAAYMRLGYPDISVGNVF